ncbi:MAG: hypothetical protein IJZ79_04340, partial [Bacilli bacterium]|nr:hypothetical protein [Bacilli bacterium]
MDNKNVKIIKVLMILSFIFIIMGGTLAYWNWVSVNDKEIIFNTSKGLEDYIIYDSGESKFVGDFKLGSSYLDGVHTTVSIYKKDEAVNASLYASINMRINEIGNKMRTLPGLKWAVTLGSSTDNGEVLANGNFLNLNSNDEILLLPYIEVTTEITEYTIWIWLDENESTSYEMSGETVDTSIWTQVDQIVDDIFEITRLNNDYQVINATVVNSKNKIVSYAITNDNIEPVLNSFDNVTLSPLVNKEEVKATQIDNETVWIDIPVEEQNKVYNFEYTVSEIGTYYIWFKDSEGQIISNSVNVSEIKTNIPLCTWGEFSDSTLKFNQESTIELTCIDTENSFSDSEITLNDIT